MDFLPPHAYVTKELIGITNQALESLPDSIFSRKSLQSMEGYSQVKLASFTADNSPLVFKSYLTLMVGDTLAKPMSCQHRFYVSELVKTDLPPQMFLGDTRADRFYVIKGQQVSTRPVAMTGGVKGATLTPGARR
jgi:hypothetical protein